jgi:uncharacterized delta-60 repeat protein
MAIAIGNNQFTQIGQIKIGNNNVQRVYRGNDLIFPYISFNGIVDTIALQPDGKILVGGDFTSYNGFSFNRIIRLNSDFTIDSSFQPLNGFDEKVRVITLQEDGKILVGGDFTIYQTFFSYRKIIRLNSNGSVDSSFNIGTGFGDVSGTASHVNDIKIQSLVEPAIIVGGFFGSYNGRTANNIIALNLDGTVKSTFPAPFASPTGDRVGFKDGSVLTIIIYPFDNNIVVGGSFTQLLNLIGDADAKRIYKFNSDYTRNSSFGDGFNGVVRSIKLASFGRLLIGGFFSIYNNTNIGNSIIMLNFNNTIDTTFNTGTGFNNFIRNVNIDSNEKVIALGGFDSYNGITTFFNFATFKNNFVRYFTRLNSNGSLDFTLDNVGSNFGGTIFLNFITASIIESNGNILISGGFNDYDGKPAFGLIRVSSDGTRLN